MLSKIFIKNSVQFSFHYIIKTNFYAGRDLMLYMLIYLKKLSKICQNILWVYHWTQPTVWNKPHKSKEVRKNLKITGTFRFLPIISCEVRSCDIWESFCPHLFSATSYFIKYIKQEHSRFPLGSNRIYWQQREVVFLIVACSCATDPHNL